MERKDKIKKNNWIWMPHPGHLIVSDDCKFHLNTYVGKYIVSTVGEYFPDRQVRKIHAEIYNPEWLKNNKDLKGDYFDSAYFKEFGFMRIGCGNDDIYETMIFKAVKSSDKCCPYHQTGSVLYCIKYKTSEEAFKGHLKLCNKWSKK